MKASSDVCENLGISTIRKLRKQLRIRKVLPTIRKQTVRLRIRKVLPKIRRKQLSIRKGLPTIQKLTIQLRIRQKDLTLFKKFFNKFPLQERSSHIHIPKNIHNIYGQGYHLKKLWNSNSSKKSVRMECHIN